MTVLKDSSRPSTKSKCSSTTRRCISARCATAVDTRTPVYTSVCRRHNPCELCVGNCPPNLRIGCRCNTSASSKTCRCPQNLGKKFIYNSQKIRFWAEQFKTRAIHGQPGLLGENRTVSRRDQFSSTYSLAFIDPDCREYDGRRNTDRPAGLETMRVPPPPDERKKNRSHRSCCHCCSSSRRDAKNISTSHSQASHVEECAYCGFKEGAPDFRPKIRRSLKHRRSLTLVNKTMTDSINTTYSARDKTDQRDPVSEQFLSKLNHMEEDLEFLNKHLVPGLSKKGKKPTMNESTPKAQRGVISSAPPEVSLRKASCKSRDLGVKSVPEEWSLDNQLVKKNNAGDVGYSEYIIQE